jgi:CHAT domain-containing protein
MQKIRFLLLCTCFCFFQCKKSKNPSIYTWIYQNLVKTGTFTQKDSILKHTLSKAKLQLAADDTAIANIFHKIGANYSNNDHLHRGYLDKALTYYDSALSIRKKVLPPNDVQIAKSYTVKGVAYVKKNEFVIPIPFLEQALKIYREAPKQDSVFMGYTYKDLAKCYYMGGDAHQALATYQNALHYIKPTENNYVRCFIEMGILYDRLKQPQQAAEQYQKALDWYLAAKQQDSIYIAKCYHNLGMLARALEPTESLLFFQKTLLFYQENHYDSLQKANTFVEMAKTHAVMQQYEQALQLASQSLAMRKSFYNSLKHFQITESYTVLGDIAAAQQDFQTALNQYEQAIVAFDTLTFTPMQQVEPLFGKAKMLVQLGRKKDALIIFNALDVLIQQVTSQFKEDKSKFNLVEKHFNIYEKAIQTAMDLYQTNQDVALLEKAFQFSGHSKAVALRQAMSDEKAKNFANLPKDTLEKEHFLKQEMAFQQKAFNDAPNDAQIRQQLFQAKEKWHLWIRQLETQYPNYYHLKYNENQFFRISKLQQSLPKEMLVLDFFMGDSTIFVFALTQQHVKIYPIATPIYIDSMIVALQESLHNPKSQFKNQYLTNAYTLYQLLLEKPLRKLNIDGKLTRLRIVPDGKLGYIPFDALLTKPTSDWDDTRSTTVPYLLRSYSTSYNYFSDSVFNQVALKIKNPFCGFGIDYKKSLPSDSLNPKLGFLEYAPREVDSIQQLIGGKTWKDPDATKNCFLQNATKSGILHLSMHSTINDKNPLESQLIFSKKDSMDDNLLIGNELFAQQFTCGLAVLSACRTGDGPLQRGEGIMSLARAFAYSGCPSLVMSLWSIPDRSTSNIMLNFYKNLKQNLPKDIALQQSKLRYLENPTFEPSQKTPNFWAATVIIGDVNALAFETTYSNYWLILLIISILGVMIFIKFKSFK